MLNAELDLEIAMNITNFDHVRLGSKYPSCVDVSPIFGHEERGVKAQVNVRRLPDSENYVQLRKQGDEVVLFCFTDEEHGNALPEFWQNSVILWDSRPYKI